MHPKINNNNSSINQNNTDQLNQDKNTNNYLNQTSIQHNNPSISSKNINILPANIKSHNRTMVGGKASALYRMQNAGMQVPEFTSIKVNQTTSLEQHIVDITSLQPFIADITDFNLTVVNIANIKQAIQDRCVNNPDKRNAYLQGLANFIQSDAFYNQISNSATAITIREKYNQLIASLPENTAIIVRSSGIKEDNYGDAQAGKFESIVHNKQDILKTCLQVLASGFQPNVCQVFAPQPMALIMQRCINCQFGGVAMSRTSQKDNRGKIEYVQGQPKGGVSGLAGVTPHCYMVSQDQDKVISEFIEGNVTSKFILQCDAKNNFTEEAVALDAKTEDIKLTEQQLQQIHKYLKQGEDMLLCPADIEFAIAQDGTVYIVQLRPLTVLTGGVNYATEPPENPLATGTLVSEGCCSGELYYIKTRQDAENIPQGAIIVAEHGEDWMLATSFLQKIGGFIFSQGGTNDHVAITLRQQEKPCLICQETFSAVKNKHNEIATIACCSFNAVEGAYVVKGSEFAEQLATMQSAVKSSYNTKSSSPTIRTTLELKFDSPDIAFKNLNDLNYILLEYLSSDSWLSRCFSEKGVIALSMAPHRIAIIEEAKQEIEQFFTDFELFLNGYKQYLQLGIKPETDNNSLQQKLLEAEQLANQFQQITTNVNDNLDNILQQFNNLKNQTITEGDFNKLLQDAKNIFEFTQKLNIPQTIDKINSIHDCIFWIHKEFIANLATVATNSDLGTITKYKKVKSITFPTLEEPIVVKQFCEALSKITSFKPPKLVIMQNAIIAIVELGIHACTIEMIDQAEAGKGRTLKLKISDFLTFANNRQGKIKRFWFLTQLLHNINFTENSSAIKSSFDESTSIITIEISHIKNRDIMLDKFTKLVTILNTMYNLDIKLNKLSSEWDLSTLNYRICDIFSVKNQEDFNIASFLFGAHIGDYSNIASLYNNEISRSFFEQGKKLYNGDFEYLTDADIENIINEIMVNDKEKLLYDLLINQVEIFVALAKSQHNIWFTDKEKVKKLVSDNGELLEHVDSKFRDNEDVVLIAVKQNFKALKYAGKQITGNQNFIFNLIEIINTIDKYKYIELSYLPAGLRNNENIILAMLKKNPIIFIQINSELQNNKAFILNAIKENFNIYRYISTEFRNNKEILQAYEEASKK